MIITNISMSKLLWWRQSYESTTCDSSPLDIDDEFDDDEMSSCHAMTPNKNIMPHNKFLTRIRKTLYVGGHVSASSVSAPSANSQKISRPLAEYAAEFFSEPHRGHTLNRLNSVTVAKLNATPCSLILAMIYLDRLRSTDPMFMRRITPTELFLVSMLVSSKFYYGYDEHIDMDEFIGAGSDVHLTLDQLKAIELEFLDALDWDVYVSNSDFFSKLCSVERVLAQQQGGERGWLTYTEMAQLFPSLSIAHVFLKYSAVFAVTYAASVLTLAGAFLVASQVPGTALYRPASSQSVSTPTTPTDEPTHITGSAGQMSSDRAMSDVDPLVADIDYLNALDEQTGSDGNAPANMSDQHYANIRNTSVPGRISAQANYLRNVQLLRDVHMLNNSFAGDALSNEYVHNVRKCNQPSDLQTMLMTKFM